MNNVEIIYKYFSEFSNAQKSQLETLEKVYKEWNEKINLISRKDIDSLYEKHVLHSLAIATQFEFSSGIEIIDIGTGGGFPGIPLAIFFPEVNFFLVDSIGKKIKVVQEVIHATGLNNVTAIHSRAEEIKNKKFDFAVSRAVAPLKELWKWSKPLLKKHNSANLVIQSSDSLINYKSGLICLKGGDIAQEIYESGLRPIVWEIENIFEEDFFKQKYLLYVS